MNTTTTTNPLTSTPGQIARSARTTLSQQVHELRAANERLFAEKLQLQSDLTRQEEAIMAQTDRHAALQETFGKYKAEIAQADYPAKITALEKQVKDLQSSKDLYFNLHQKEESELEQAHAVLDSVVGAPEREYSTGGTYPSSRQRNVVTRLAGAFLAIAQQGTGTPREAAK